MQPLISKSNKKNKKGYFDYIPFFNQSMETDVSMSAMSAFRRFPGGAFGGDKWGDKGQVMK